MITDKQFKYMYVLLIKYIQAEIGQYDRREGVSQYLSRFTYELFGVFISDIRELNKVQFNQLVTHLSSQTQVKQLITK